MTNAWEKTGRDAASEDIAGGAEPCATLDEARTRCGAWLRSQPSLAVTDADVEACAGAYLRTWEAHRRDTSAPDLDAIEARANAAARAYPEPWEVDGDAVIVVDDPDAPRGFPTFSRVAECPTPAVAEFIANAREDVPALVARVRDLEADATAASDDARDALAARDEAEAALCSVWRVLAPCADDIPRVLRGDDEVADVETITSRVRDLAAKLDASAQAFDDLVADVWRATGETHEPPADTAALLARVAGQRESLDGYRRAAVDVSERLDGERQEPDFDMPAEFGAYVCDEVDRFRAAVAAARREGAEAMREVCFAVCEDEGNTHNLTGAIPSRERDAREDGRRIGASRCAAAIRALPLPEAPPDASTYRRGAGAMMEACAQAVTGDGADVLRRQRDEEQAAWEREHGGEP